MKYTFIAAMLMAGALTLTACGKKEEAPAPAPTHEAAPAPEAAHEAAPAPAPEAAHEAAPEPAK